MSRILARALGRGAGPGPVRPRLPTLFEPGLDLAADQEDNAIRAGGPAHAARSGEAPSAGPELMETPAVPGTGPPPAPAGLPVSWPPAAEHGPSAAPSPSPRAGALPASAIHPAAPARPQPPENVDAAHPGRPGQAHPFRPGPAPQTPRAVTEPQAPRPHPPDGAAQAILPVPSADRRPGAAAHRGPMYPRPQSDGNPAASRRAAARQARGGAEAEPVVHISIGRVEIRADRAAARPGRQASRPRSAAPDLSEYLQRRGQQR